MSTAIDSEPLATVGRRLDLGRVAMVLVFTATTLSNSMRIAHLLRTDVSSVRAVTEVLSSVLALSFCLLMLLAYLRRGPARATDRNPMVWLAAPTATFLPFAVASIPPADGGSVRTALGMAITLAGITFSVWAVRRLATNLSVVPQARAVVAVGPYRWVRHPLYLGELIALAGVVLHVGRPPAVAAFVLEVGLQMFRAHREERLLATQLPGYAEYAARTSRIVPGVW